MRLICAAAALVTALVAALTCRVGIKRTTAVKFNFAVVVLNFTRNGNRVANFNHVCAGTLHTVAFKALVAYGNGNGNVGILFVIRGVYLRNHTRKRVVATGKRFASRQAVSRAYNSRSVRSVGSGNHRTKRKREHFGVARRANADRCRKSNGSRSGGNGKSKLVAVAKSSAFARYSPSNRSIRITFVSRRKFYRLVNLVRILNV